MILGTISHYEKPTKKILKKTKQKQKQKPHNPFYSSFKVYNSWNDHIPLKTISVTGSFISAIPCANKINKKKNNNNAVKSFDIVWVAITTQLLDPCLDKKQNGEREGRGFRP